MHHGVPECDEEAEHDDDPQDENDDARNRLVFFHVFYHVNLGLKRNRKQKNKKCGYFGHKKTKVVLETDNGMGRGVFRSPRVGIMLG